jgi:alkaline phosphatase D
VCYQQTYHHDGEYVSLLPLITNGPPAVTHLILSAIHINWDPKNLTLNDHPPDDPRYTQLWDEAMVLQDSGVKVMAMLGGAARGSFARLDYSESRTDIPPQRFESYYAPLRDMLRQYSLDGLDLDVEEEFSLPGVVHLIDRLRSDFGPDFIITLAPVATALMPSRPHLSGFDYRLLEAARGSSIAWYNTQFYNGWGGIDAPWAYEEIMRAGWRPEKVVAGMLTNPRHGGSGYVLLQQTAVVLSYLMEKYPGFGGVMGWEYWASLPNEGHCWQWPYCMRLILGMKEVRDAAVIVAAGRRLSRLNVGRTEVGSR